MSFHQHKRASSSTQNSSKLLRLPRMRPIATTAKKLTSKVKSIRILRIFRTRTPIDIPFSQREVTNVARYHRKTDTGKTESVANHMRDGQDWRTRVLSNGVQAMPREQWRFASEEANKRDVDIMPVSDCDHVDVEFHVTDVNETDVSDTGPPSYVTIIKGLRGVSQERRFSTHHDLTFDETNPAEWTQDIDEGISCETFYTAISAAKWVTHEPQSFHFEIDPMQSETQLTSPGSDQSQQQSSDLSTSDILARVLFPDLGVHKDTSSAFESSATELVAETNCETVNSNDDVARTQRLKNSETLGLDKPQHILENKLNDIDTEKAERIERRRKVLAKKKEARLKKAMEYSGQDAVRIGNTCLKGSELTPRNESPIADDGTHVGACSSEESKTEDGFAYGTEDISDPAEWSKDEARKAKERRKDGQKERLLNLLSGCIILHTGSAFEGDGYSNQLV